MKLFFCCDIYDCCYERAAEGCYTSSQKNPQIINVKEIFGFIKIKVSLL